MVHASSSQLRKDQGRETSCTVDVDDHAEGIDSGSAAAAEAKQTGPSIGQFGPIMAAAEEANRKFEAKDNVIAVFGDRPDFIKSTEACDTAIWEQAR